MSPISTLDRYYYGLSNNKYTLPSKEAELNTYLNTTYYSTLNSIAQSMVKQDAIYKVGIANDNGNVTTEKTIEQLSSVKWKGKIALIDVSEYIRASTNWSCYNLNTASHNSCKNNNWMHTDYLRWWTLSPKSSNYSSHVWIVYGDDGRINSSTAFGSYVIRPVVTLSSEVQITGGDGTENNAFTLTI